MPSLSFWQLKSGEFGSYLECSKCKKKVSVVDYIFADKAYKRCPKCNSEMRLKSDVTYDEILSLASAENKTESSYS